MSVQRRRIDSLHPVALPRRAYLLQVSVAALAPVVVPDPAQARVGQDPRLGVGLRVLEDEADRPGQSLGLEHHRVAQALFVAEEVDVAEVVEEAGLSGRLTPHAQPRSFGDSRSSARLG